MPSNTTAPAIYGPATTATTPSPPTTKRSVAVGVAKCFLAGLKESSECLPPLKLAASLTLCVLVTIQVLHGPFFIIGLLIASSTLAIHGQQEGMERFRRFDGIRDRCAHAEDKRRPVTRNPSSVDNLTRYTLSLRSPF